ncbi:hypothetical protein E2C01_054696 [Portunus trituberculatus]|uniref:Uncharacterized protein n=1 Tax=Portunus trituberculatus TaxID=210409 RepID=A0A5B7GKC1_PORTR|nr:hypothetical protein [Portunus trituberculatus]
MGGDGLLWSDARCIVHHTIVTVPRLPSVLWWGGVVPSETLARRCDAHCSLRWRLRCSWRRDDGVGWHDDRPPWFDPILTCTL